MITKSRKRPPDPAAVESAPSAEPRASSPGIRFRLDFHDRCSVGIGKVSLLEAIARTGSLSQAARDIGMSYRRAWLLIDSMHAEFDTPVINATVGGSGGGGAQLSSFGRKLIQAYRNLEARISPLALEHMSEVATHVAGSRRGARPAKRQKLSVPLT
ncbi:MAG TPA: LysR family transcriptional regulator [Steroidobacteraceae bacterium]|nr:LysR family transcriptional regulator [Steroidobacteraceae bacterium]